MDDESPVLCPRGVVISLHKEVSAFLTHRVIVELALIITFPSVAAMAHRDAKKVMEPQLLAYIAPLTGGS